MLLFTQYFVIAATRSQSFRALATHSDPPQCNLHFPVSANRIAYPITAVLIDIALLQEAAKSPSTKYEAA